MGASGIVKKKMTSYGFAAFRFNVSSVMITTLNSVKETHLWSSPSVSFAGLPLKHTAALPFLAGPSSVLTKCKCHGDLRSWWTAESATPLIRRSALTSFYPHCDFLPNMEEVELLLLLPCLNEMLKFRASLGNEPAPPCTDL